MNIKTILVASALAAMTISILAGCTAEKEAAAPASETKAAPKVEAAPKAEAPQAVTVTVDGEFKPAEVKVKAGQPVELTFDTKNFACAKTVVFKSLGITKELTDGTKTVVAFTPKEAGKIEYACGMDMLKGTVVVE